MLNLKPAWLSHVRAKLIFSTNLITGSSCLWAIQFRNRNLQPIGTPNCSNNIHRKNGHQCKILRLNVIHYGIHCPGICASWHRLPSPQRWSPEVADCMYLYSHLRPLSLRDSRVQNWFSVLVITAIRAPWIRSHPTMSGNIVAHGNRRMLDSMAGDTAINFPIYWSSHPVIIYP